MGLVTFRHYARILFRFDHQAPIRLQTPLRASLGFPWGEKGAFSEAGHPEVPAGAHTPRLLFSSSLGLGSSCTFFISQPRTQV